ncbi:MAG: hypothetical protein CVU56_27915 [Deltaproteobacteria bacterium HGW-Deltaproteobacteria-14]|jgi:hypothetical protein|nr:MAG: hypothetical protein CVU56_27915 [Deltaproteobacteria bacterium HGW-Deltaproteobacteria-14]
MRRTLLLLVTALLVLGCGDDVVKPGGLEVRWTQGPLATCGSRNLVQLESRAYLKNVLKGTGTSSCPAAERTGSMIIEELPPGNYTVVVEGFDADSKGVYLGMAEKVGVQEAKSTTTAVIELVQKPVRLNVTWTTPTGKCAASPIRKVEVNVYVNAGTDTQLADAEQGVCEAESPNPEDPSQMLAGLVFDGLVPNGDVVVIAYGLDSKGDKIAKGQSESFILAPGDFVTKEIPLTTCAGDPPACE